MHTSFEQLWRARYRKILGILDGELAFEAVREVGLTTPIRASEVYEVYAKYILAANPPLSKHEMLDHAFTALGRNLSLEWLLFHEHRQALVTQWLMQNA